ncbi:hypothetical protein K432DRAFT_301974 [Lepidopterella palustris CBS 459.81]|uniref:Ubiquitin carboxyl-terminal hydrolase 19 n=1 Tax=Lepidopterella palustris CBS 459.81 TaxID=1314670 RepID=A0A8E2E779_9PEZI|nr:hypothetical protein K432DRAFT_301974 [Lepidopterella palustris CBS 459.81]
MDPQSLAFTPRDDFWRFQSEMLRVQQTQADLSERLARVERRQDEDARVKSVWGTSSPFPSVLSGTPQQVALNHHPSEPFSNFDDHSSNLIGNLQLDADDEPRRMGATSRANSVRFDESANQGHWAHASRSSMDLIPRTGSGLGGHLMTERSYSHKSDGRQSSAGQSVHSATSGRANSLGLDTGYGLSNSGISPLDPPGISPGLFILGSVPAIIRCWLNTNFKNDSLLYAAVCSGSYASQLDIRIIEYLGFQTQIVHDDGIRKIKLAVYLPEAISLTASSRSSSPAPQLPSLTVDFTVVENSEDESGSKAIQIFLGSDMLRAHNADILFSSNMLTLFDDDRNKLQIPFVRPEDDRTFKSLCLTSGSTNHQKQPAALVDTAASTVSDAPSIPETSPPVTSHQKPATGLADLDGMTAAGLDDGGSTGRQSLEQRPLLGLVTGRTESKEGQESSPANSSISRSGPSPAIWSNWRREGDRSSSMDWANASKNSSSTYQRRDTGIKVLKPVKPGTRTLSSSTTQSPSPATGQSRFFDDGRCRTSTTSGSETGDHQLKRAGSGEKTPSSTKENMPIVTKTRSSNPVGGASAFAWLNNGDGHTK